MSVVTGTGNRRDGKSPAPGESAANRRITTWATTRNDLERAPGRDRRRIGDRYGGTWSSLYCGDSVLEPCIFGFAGSGARNFANTPAAHRIEPVEIELGARALPIPPLTFACNILRIRLAILVAGYCIELPASGLLAILCQASFSGCIVVSFTVNLFSGSLSLNPLFDGFSRGDSRRRAWKRRTRIQLR